MYSMQLRVEKDPLTGRDIGKECWNGHHDEGCDEDLCKCLCHERRASVARKMTGVNAKCSHVRPNVEAVPSTR